MGIMKIWTWGWVRTWVWTWWYEHEYEDEDDGSLFDQNNALTAENEHEAQVSTSDEDIFFIEEIKDHRIRNGQRNFLIKWQGVPIEEQKWESEVNILNETLIEPYFNNQNTSPQNINTCVIIFKPAMIKINQRRA